MGCRDSAKTAMTDRALRLEVATSEAWFAALALPWTALWMRADGSTFQSHGWIAAWLGALPVRRQPRLRLVLAWREDDLVGVLPLVVRRYRGLRVLEWAAKDVTDYCDALVEAGVGKAGIVRAMWAAITREGGWDVAYLSHLVPGSAIGEVADSARAASAPFRPGRRMATSFHIPAPLDPTRSWFDTLPRKKRQNYRRSGATLAEMGISPRFRLVEPSQPKEALLVRLIELKTGWLRRTGRSSPLLEEDGLLFRRLVDVLARAGSLRLFVLEGADGRLLAGSVNFVEHGRLLAFFTAYDPAYERGSVGIMTFVEAIGWAFDNGLSEVDFLCGAEEFKRRLDARAVTLRSVVAARTLLGRAALALESAAHAVRERRARSGTALSAMPAGVRSAALAPQTMLPPAARAAPAGPIRLRETR